MEGSDSQRTAVACTAREAWLALALASDDIALALRAKWTHNRSEAACAMQERARGSAHAAPTLLEHSAHVCAVSVAVGSSHHAMPNGH